MANTDLYEYARQADRPPRRLEQYNPNFVRRVRTRRTLFSFLPASYISDHEQSASVFVFAAFIAVCAPFFPLAALYEGWWAPENEKFRVIDQAVGFALLIGAGLCFLIGSLLHHRSIRNTPLTPLFMSSDHLHALWWVFMGTLLYVPITAIYAYYLGYRGPYGFALALALLTSILMQLVVMSATYSTQKIELLSPYLQGLSSGNHFESDKKIFLWFTLLLSFMSIVTTTGLLIHFAIVEDSKATFDFAVGTFEALLVAVGAMYSLAGAYEIVEEEMDIEHAPTKAFEEGDRTENVFAVESDDIPPPRINSNLDEYFSNRLSVDNRERGALFSANQLEFAL